MVSKSASSPPPSPPNPDNVTQVAKLANGWSRLQTPPVFVCIPQKVSLVDRLFGIKKRNLWTYVVGSVHVKPAKGHPIPELTVTEDAKLGISLQIGDIQTRGSARAFAPQIETTDDQPR